MTTYCNGVALLQHFAELAVLRTCFSTLDLFKARSAVNTKTTNCKIALFRVSETAISKADLSKSKSISRRKNKGLGKRNQKLQQLKRVRAPNARPDWPVNATGVALATAVLEASSGVIV